MRLRGNRGPDFLLLSMMADLAGSNNLVKHLWAERAASHNARVRDVGYGTFIVILDGPCQGHIVHRIQTSCFQTKQLVSKVYNCCFTLNNVNKWAVLRAGLVRVVKEDLGVNLFRSQRPSVQNREHNQRILESTYLRDRHIKIRQHVADNSREREATSTAEMLLDILNGDWRKDCLQHWCFEPRCPCQKSIDTLVDIVVPLLERAVFEPMSAITPAHIRACSRRWQLGIFIVQDPSPSVPRCRPFSPGEQRRPERSCKRWIPRVARPLQCESPGCF